MTEVDAKEIIMFLQKHSSWNRSLLSRELCVLWDWRHPDGQIKDMACRELLRKLEFRTLIKLPPHQHPGPKRAPKIESVEIVRNPISRSFSELKPVKVISARECVEYEELYQHLLSMNSSCILTSPVFQKT